MTGWAKRPALCLLMAAALAPAAAAVSGTVVNKSTGQPVAGALVTLYTIGEQGMQPAGSVKSGAEGRFQIDADVQGPALLQAIYDGVVYTRMLAPGSPTTGVEVDVYDTTAKPDGVAVEQHMVLLEPISGILHVSESILVRNSSDRAFYDAEKGAFRVWIPPETRGAPRLMVTAPQGMPVSRDLVKVSDDGVWKIDVPLKPGETRFDITYVLPDAEPLVFTGKVLHGGRAVRLVTPDGVTLSGEGVAQIGEEPQTHAKVYEVSGREYSVTITGTGSLQMPEAQPSGGGAGIQQIRPRLYDRIAVITGLTLLILLAGFLLLYRRTAPPAAAGSDAASATEKAGGAQEVGRRR